MASNSGAAPRRQACSLSCFTINDRSPRRKRTVWDPLEFCGMIGFIVRQAERRRDLRRHRTLIPLFNEDGLLPQGLHIATLAEIAERFGTDSELRRVQMESIRRAWDAASRAGVERFVINGSFVTDVPEPNDVDCVLLIGPTFPLDSDAEAELLAGFPFLDIQLVKDPAFRVLVQLIFATDRSRRPKGMIEVLL
jgi:hypothetical protein